jgi:hypothetical protein
VAGVARRHAAGAQPRWMTAAIKAGAKRDDFLVGKKAKASEKD